MTIKKFIFICLVCAFNKANSQEDSINYYLNLNINDSTKIELCNKYIGNAITIDDKLKKIKRVEKYYLDANNIKMQGFVEFLIGNIYFDYSKYDLAINNLYKALPLAEKTNFKWLQAKIYNYLGIIFSEQGDSKKAVYYFRKTFELAITLRDISLQLVSANNVAVDYTELGESQKSIYFLNKAELILKSKKYKNTSEYLVSVFGNKLTNYLNLKDGINSKKQFDSINKYFTFCKSSVSANISFNHFMGSYYIFTQEYKKALYFLERNTKIIERDDYSEQKKLYKDLTTCYVKTKYFEKAFDSQNMFLKYSDSIADNDKIRESVELEGKYNNIKIESELKISKLTNTNNELKLKRNKLLIISVLIVCIITLISLIIFYKLYKNNKKANKLLVVKNYIIEEKQREILASIRYAKRIQDSFLASEKYINNKLKKLMGK